MAIRMKKISLNRIFILAVMLILAAGLCACGKKDDGTDISSEEAYDVLSVDSVEGNGIDYGKYEISGDGYNDAGENDNGDGNISGSDKSNGISDSEDDGDNDGNGSVSKKENNDGDGGGGSAGKKDNDGDKSGDSEKMTAEKITAPAAITVTPKKVTNLLTAKIKMALIRRKIITPILIRQAAKRRTAAFPRRPSRRMW